MLKTYKILMNIAVAGTLFSYSCAGEGTVDEAEEVVEETVEEEEQTSGKVVYYGTPSLVEVASLMKSSGAQFSAEHMNSLDNAQNYVANHKKALNFGVYGADLTYASMFDHTQEAISYLKTVKDMAEELGLTGAFEESLLQSIESNISNRDSLLDIITDFYWSADAYLVDNDRGEVASLIITGGWVESMYLACTMLRENPDNQELIERIAEQKLILKNLVLFLQNSAGDDAQVVEIRERMRELSDFYATVEIKHVAGENVTDAEAGETVIGNETVIAVQPGQMDDLTMRIEEIRMSFIN